MFVNECLVMLEVLSGVGWRGYIWLPLPDFMNKIDGHFKQTKVIIPRFLDIMLISPMHVF